MRKRWNIVTVALTLCLAVHPMSALAGEVETGWLHDGSGWRYYFENGECPTKDWAWLDGNYDGIAECYYFGSDGYLVTGTVVDGDTVNSDGAWVIDGVVQTRYGTGFIKQHYLDLLGKPQEEVERVLGTDYIMSDKSIVAYYWQYMDYTLNGAKPAQVEVTLLDGKVEHISAKGVTFFNATKDSYTISEISSSLGVSAEIDERGGATWYLPDGSSKCLSYWEDTYTLEWIQKWYE